MRPLAPLLPLLPLLLVVVGACADRSPKPAPTAAASATPTPAAVAVTPTATTKIERPANNAIVARESSALLVGSIEGAAHAFVADEDDGAIVDVDIKANLVSSSTSIGSRPRDLLLLADGRIAATLPEQAAVAILAREQGETGKLREVARIKTPEEPLALALSPDDATLYVTTGASHSLLAFATDESLKEKSRHALGREPRAVLATADSVFVTHAAETFTSILSLADSKITTRAIDNRLQCGGGQYCQGARIARGAQAIVRMGERGIVIPTAQALPNPPHGFTKSYLCGPIDRQNQAATRARREAIERTGVTGYGIGSGETGPPIIPDLQVVDAKDGSLYGVGSLPLTASVHDHACLLPRAAIALGKESKDGLVVACLGSSSIMRSLGTSRFDLSAAAKREREYMANGIVANVTADYVNVPPGPSGVAVHGSSSLLVWSLFARKLSTIDLTAIGKKGVDAVVASSIEIPRVTAKDETWLAGRALFYKNHDRRISADGRACANCHIDGRDDGITWRTPMGPRRTRMLAGQTTTGPFGWKGDNATLEAHIKTTIHNLEGSGLPDEDMAKLTAFVTSINKAPPASAAAALASDQTVAKGKEIFQSAECSSCHTTGGSDRTVHDVGTGGGYVTPTLAGVAMRDQLMHDGRYKNLDALLTGATSMGRGSQLSPEDRQALVKYLETL